MRATQLIARGWQKVLDSRQLVYTLLMALVICGAFLFVADRFVRIAHEAQEQITHVRTTTLHTTFSDLLLSNWNDRDFLQAQIVSTLDRDRTLTHFYVFDPEMDNVLLGDGGDVAAVRMDNDILLQTAQARPDQAFTTEVRYRGAPAFLSWQALVGPDDVLLGYIVTQQTLSQASQRIAENIQNGIIILIVVLVLLMVLFLRHARIVDYTVLYKKLKEVDEMKDDFISMASHELKSPLTVIRGYVDMIKTGPDDKETIIEQADRIDTAAQQLNTLVEDMLDVNRLEQGRMEFKLETADLNEMVQPVVDSYTKTAADKGLSLHFERSDESVLVVVDVNKMRQVVTNLVSNALKYTLEGEVILRTSMTNGHALLEVADTGIGLTAEERERLFGKFVRLPDKQTATVKGTGLGLWITKQMIEAMSGSITVESMKGVGSRFIVKFPVAQDQAA